MAFHARSLVEPVSVVTFRSGNVYVEEPFPAEGTEAAEAPVAFLPEGTPEPPVGGVGESAPVG
jgi:hypothetical protein